MLKKLFIGGLPYSATDDELKEHFSAAGNVVSAQVIMDKFSGRSKGFGFIEMSTEEEAEKAIQMFNGQDFGGRQLAVNEARPKTEGPRGGSHGGFGGGRGRGGFGNRKDRF